MDVSGNVVITWFLVLTIFIVLLTAANIYLLSRSEPKGDTGPEGTTGATGPPGTPFASMFASFQSNENQFMGSVLSQTAAVAGYTPLKYNLKTLGTDDIFCSTSLNNGASSVTGDSRIFVSQPGNYKISYSIQMDNLAGGGQTYTTGIWLRVNGNVVPDSGSEVAVVGAKGMTFVFCEYLQSFSGGDNFDIVYYAENTNAYAASFASASSIGAGVIPTAVPSIITNVYSIG